MTVFTSSDGTNSWTFTHGLVALANPSLGCFLVGTQSTRLGPAGSGGPCGVGVSGPGSQAGFAIYTEGGLPTVPGTYPQLEFGGELGGLSGLEPLTHFSNAAGSMTLTITDAGIQQTAGCAVGSKCNVVYEFNYTAINGPVKSFSFSFTSPTYLKDGDTPVIAEFTPTDGSNYWTFARGAADVSNPATPFQQGCFMFGTSFAGLGPLPTFGGSCGVGVGGPGTQAGVYISTSGGLPISPGTYAGLQFSGSFGASPSFESIGTISDAVNNTGIMTLTISETPAPHLAGTMADSVAAGNWQTSFTLFNKDASASQVNLNLFGDDGNPLSALLFAERADFSTSSSGVSLASNASVVLTSSGPTNHAVEMGSARLVTKGNVGGFAIFRNTLTNQEASVPLETRNASSYILAFDNTDGIALGVALQNVSALQGRIPVILRDDSGTQIGTDSITLAGLGHTSFVLGELYPATANLRGTIEFDTPSGGRISALGIRFTPPGTLTTIPVLANINNFVGSVAHIASGGGWKTTVVLVNTGTTSVVCALTFFDDAGNLLPLPLSFSKAGASSLFPRFIPTLAAHSSMVIESQGLDSDAVKTGSMQLYSNAQVSGFVIFRYVPSGQEAVAPFESGGASAYIIPFDHTNGIVTGTAINNASITGADVPVVLRGEDGKQIGTGSIALAGNGHAAFVLSSQFPVTENIRGTAEFTMPVGAEINVLGIRTTPAGTFTTLPPVTR